MVARVGTAITAHSYAVFIQKVVNAHGGRITENDLNKLIEEKYAPYWTATDLRPWGDQHHPKWKQNVASAKSALDRRGIVVRCVVRTQREQVVWRVAMPDRFTLAAVQQWLTRRRGSKKPTYAPLPQPEQQYVVPEL